MTTEQFIYGLTGKTLKETVIDFMAEQRKDNEKHERVRTNNQLKRSS